MNKKGALKESISTCLIFFISGAFLYAQTPDTAPLSEGASDRPVSVASAPESSEHVSNQLNELIENKSIPIATPKSINESDQKVLEREKGSGVKERVSEIPEAMTVVREREVETQEKIKKDEVKGTYEESEWASEKEHVGFNEIAKRKATVALVERGIDYFNTHAIADVCHVFSHTKKFVEGELYIFMYGIDGTVLAHGQQINLIWKNLYNVQDSFGTPVVQSIIKKAQEGGGWIIYNWRHATKVSYVKLVQKEGKSYVVGAGYYPHSKPDAVVNLVKGAVGFFNKMVQEGRPIDDAFSPLSYPLGRFVYGDLYLYALDFKGNNVAHGGKPSLIGSNSWNYRDANGVLVNQEIVKKLTNTSKGIWIEYQSGGALKRAYVEKVRDAAGNWYFIACGYYPDANRKMVVELVRKGYQFMRTHGLAAAQEAFSDTHSINYRYGDLYLFVYDMDGTLLVQGTNREFIGQNHKSSKDDDGRLYVRDLMQKAREGGGWVDVKMKGSFKSIYVEKVDLGISSYVIGSGVYPISKHESMELLAKSGADYLKGHEEKNAFAAFVDQDAPFIRGDLHLFVFGADEKNKGVCYAFGDEKSVVWRPLLEAVDDNGVLFVQEIINTAKYGATTVRYTLNGVEKIGYVMVVRKGDSEFVVGSSYFK